MWLNGLHTQETALLPSHPMVHDQGTLCSGLRKTALIQYCYPSMISKSSPFMLNTVLVGTTNYMTTS